LQEDRRQKPGSGNSGNAHKLVDVRHGISPAVVATLVILVIQLCAGIDLF
jgi:hypothetical protein